MLILGSYGFAYTSVRNKIGEIITDKSGKMLIIPLACMFGTETGENEKNYASMLGFKKENIYVFDEANYDELLDMKFDYIVVLGGNTFKLLYGIRKYNLDTFIREQVTDGAIYMGFSAGACIACNDIEYVKNFDDNNHIINGDFTALGLTDKYVLCHFDFRGYNEIEMCRKYIGNEAELITINNSQLVVI